jgi:hypothetical protein
MPNKAAKRRRPRAKTHREPFALSKRELAIVANWQSTQSLSPKLTCVIDDCALSTVYERLNLGQYQAVKDGHRTRIITESIKNRRERLQPYQPGHSAAAQ